MPSLVRIDTCHFVSPSLLPLFSQHRQGRPSILFYRLSFTTAVMAPLNFLNLLAAATLAVIALSYSPAPVAALSPDSHGQIFARRGVHHGMRREPASNKKRSNSKRCKVRESSSLVSSSTVSSYTPASTSSTTPYVAPATSSSSSSAVASTTPASSSSGSGVWTGPKGGLAWPNGDTGKLSNWKTGHMT